MVIGAQLYTVRDFTQTVESFDDTLRRISRIGYSCVQISGIGNIPAEKVREIADKHCLGVILTHTAWNRLLHDTQEVIEDHKIMGAEYVGLGAMPEEYRGSLEGVNRFIADVLPIAKQISESGLKFMYHNHHFEFERFGGKLCLDYLADGIDSTLMGFVLDTYWVQAAGADPAFYLKKYAGRLDTIHLKDMHIVKEEKGAWAKQEMCPVLEGNINWGTIFEACTGNGTRYAFVEQDYCYGEDPFLCLERSFNNLKKYGYIA